MALVLIKEDGSAKADANSYADAADGDAYHDAHLYATDWTGAAAGTKDKALVMSSRLIDESYQFNGTKLTAGQAMQWPRLDARDPDRPRSVNTILSGDTLAQDFPANAVPKLLVDAVCELARLLIVADRTADPDGQGLSAFSASGAMALTFDKKDQRPLLPRHVQNILSKLGTIIGNSSGAVRVTRV